MIENNYLAKMCVNNNIEATLEKSQFEPVELVDVEVVEQCIMLITSKQMY